MLNYAPIDNTWEGIYQSVRDGGSPFGIFEPGDATAYRLQFSEELDYVHIMRFPRTSNTAIGGFYLPRCVLEQWSDGDERMLRSMIIDSGMHNDNAWSANILTEILAAFARTYSEKKPWTWGEDEFESREAACAGIAAAVADQLDNTEACVTDPAGVEYRIQVTIELYPI